MCPAAAEHFSKLSRSKGEPLSASSHPHVSLFTQSVERAGQQARHRKRALPTLNSFVISRDPDKIFSQCD